MKIVSWQSVLTDHQSHTMRALQDLTGNQLLVVSGAKELEVRQGQGWTTPDIGGLDVRYLPISGWWQSGLSILSENKDAVHIFNGLWGDRRFFPLLIAAQRMGLHTALMTEPYADVPVGYLQEELLAKSKIKTFVRPWLYKLAGFLIAKRLIALFAISDKAFAQFAKIGVRSEVIFPFGYFVPALEVKSVRDKKEGERIRLIFVGSLIKRKGIHCLLDVMKICAIRKINISLDIYGPGEFAEFERVQGVNCKGTIPFGKSQEVIAQYDVLVLPSLHDGWGVVVNEALLQGVPAIVSTRVGAKALIERSGAGKVLECNDINGFVKTFGTLSTKPEILLSWRKKASAFKHCLTPEMAANYLYKNLCFALETKSEKMDTLWYKT